MLEEFFQDQGYLLNDRPNLSFQVSNPFETEGYGLEGKNLTPVDLALSPTNLE